MGFKEWWEENEYEFVSRDTMAKYCWNAALDEAIKISKKYDDGRMANQSDLLVDELKKLKV